MPNIDKIRVDNVDYNIVGSEADYVVSTNTINSWKVVKWNSGRVECYIQYSLQTISSSLSYKIVDISLPIELVNTNYLVNYNVGIGSGWADWVHAIVEKTTTNFSIMFIRKNNTNLENNIVDIYINGSWK